MISKETNKQTKKDICQIAIANSDKTERTRPRNSHEKVSIHMKTIESHQSLMFFRLLHIFGECDIDWSYIFCPCHDLARPRRPKSLNVPVLVLVCLDFWYLVYFVFCLFMFFYLLQSSNYFRPNRSVCNETRNWHVWYESPTRWFFFMIM